MNKFAFFLFGTLTLGATYFTAYDVGVQEANAYYAGASVRSGSVGNYGYAGSGK